MPRFLPLLFGYRRRIITAVAALTLALGLAAILMPVAGDPARHVASAQFPGIFNPSEPGKTQPAIAVLVTFPHTPVWTPNGLEALARLEREVSRVPGVDPTTLVSLLTPRMAYGAGENGKPEGELTAAALMELKDLVRPPVIRDGVVSQGPLRERWRQKDIGWLSRLADLLGLKGRLVSVDGRSVIMRIAMAPPPKPDGPSYGDVFRGLMRAGEQALQGMHFKMSVAGIPLRMGGLDASLERGWPWLLLLLTMVVAGFWYVARSVPAAIAAFVVALMPVVWICGGMALLGHGFGPMGWPVLYGAFAVTILGGGVGLGLYTSRVAWGDDREQGAKATMALGLRLGIPALIVGCVALIPLALLPGTAMRDAAILGAIGIVIGLGAMLTMLPLILSLVPSPQTWLDDVARMAQMQRDSIVLFGRLVERGFLGRAALMAAFGLVAGLAVMGVNRSVPAGAPIPAVASGTVHTETVASPESPQAVDGTAMDGASVDGASVDGAAVNTGLQESAFVQRGPLVLPFAVLVIAGLSGILVQRWGVAFATLGGLTAGCGLALGVMVLATSLQGPAILTGLSLGLFVAVPVVGILIIGILIIGSTMAQPTCADIHDTRRLTWDILDRPVLAVAALLSFGMLAGPGLTALQAATLLYTTLIATPCFILTGLVMQALMPLMARLDRP